MLAANHIGDFTRPSPRQYPHQWNWDSAFIALGWSVVDGVRARSEIESMLRARWREGMVPHIRFDPAGVDAYFPGPDRWPRAAAHVAVPGSLTSGITNPPVLALAARLVGEREPDVGTREGFWRSVLPPLVEWVRYLLSDRRLAGSPLVTVVHPWETGWDNSPRWDFLAPARLRPARPYQRLDTVHVGGGQRPSGKDYDAFVALIEILDAADYDLATYRTRTPFLVYDVLFDALTYRAMTDTNAIAVELGEPEPFDSETRQDFAAAFEEFHRGPDGAYFDWDCVAGRRIDVPTAAGVAALAGGLPAMTKRAEEIFEAYERRLGAALPVATVPPGMAVFDRALYWRGPVWINVNWLVIDGLRRAGRSPEAGWLREETIDIVERSGFAEYFDALDGAPLGIDGFSWSAALTLDLLS